MPDIEGSSNLMLATLQAIAERGLSSFLQAIAAVAPEIDLQQAADCWIRAVEGTDWNPEMSSETFISQITIGALTTYSDSEGSSTNT